MSHCPKQQRNGPCGGSTGGWCEGYPGERKCIWNQAYARLKASAAHNVISPHIIPPTNWKLKASSSWLNYYLGKDHTAIRLGVRPLEKQANAEGVINTIKETIDSLVCSIDTDCPAGYVCVEGRCIPHQM